MATTLSYGYIKPSDGDKGGVFFPALAANIEQLNDHDHDGQNSAKLTAVSSDAVQASLIAADWGSAVDGLYEQTVTMPIGMKYPKTAITFRNAANQRTLLLTAQRIDDDSYKVYCNDPTLNVSVVYTT